MRETIQTQVTQKIDFKGKELFIGLDVHKKSSSVTIVVDANETSFISEIRWIKRDLSSKAVMSAKLSYKDN